MRYSTFSSLLVCSLFCASLLAQQRAAFNLRSTVFQAETHAVIDISFNTGKTSLEQPFEVDFGAIFQNENGSKLQVPGFYNGGSEYVLRFSAPKQGKWTFVTQSSLPVLAGLKGQVQVLANPDSDQHGALKVSSQFVQKFEYEDGSPCFPLAFELDWLFALDYGNAGTLPKSSEIIQAVKANGFNQVVMNVYAYDVNWAIAKNVPAPYYYGKPNYGPFPGGNEKPDFSSLNVAFFQHFDRVIELLRRQNISAHLMIYVWNKNVKWPEMYSPGDNRYFDYVIKRYQAYPNIIWDVSKEALDYGRCDIPYINERISRIRRLDAYQRLVTVHDYEYCAREPERVDFISIQNWRSDLQSLSLAAYQRHANKPVMNIEHGGYEQGPYASFSGNYVNPEVCLIRNYQCVFAGLYSCYYWQNTSWNIVVYDPLKPGQAFPAPRFDYYKHLQSLFSRYDFRQLQPSVPKLTTNSRLGADNYASSAYPLSNGKDLFLYLVPAENEQINVVLPKPESGKMKATWFNPFTGEWIDKGSSDWYVWKGYQSPWPGKYSVLVLEY
jgi:hypothetical protein